MLEERGRHSPEVGLVFDPRPPRLLAGRMRSWLRPGAGPGRGSPLRLLPIEVPEPFGPDWVRVEPRYSGVCGSDVTQAQLKADADNPLSGLVSFPHVMGHEVVGQVDGEWVAIDPWLGCLARGTPPCASCAAGMPALCQRLVEPVVPGRTGAGMHLGTVRGLPGGFGTLMLAHRSQCRPLPPSLDPRAAVLADPLAVALHAVERSGFEGSRPALVLGAGTIGLCVVALLRRVHPGAEILATAAWPHLAEEVRALGAEPVGIGSRSVTSALSARTGTGEVRPWLGSPWLAGDGAEVVIDAVGSAETAQIALRAVRPLGRVVRVGVGRAARVQSTLHYFKEVEVVGSNGYRAGDLDRALALLAEGAVPASRWLTHRFALTDWRHAFRAAAHPGKHASVKVVICTAVRRPTTE
jgi:threonine dehydrogenase-like Zn-dependent dehydrogenase